MRITEQESLQESVLDIAKKMMVAAKTAPKARGIDVIRSLILTQEDLHTLADKMEAMGEEADIPFFVRDAENIRNCQGILLIGAKDMVRHVPNCGLCGFGDCAGKVKAGGRCAFDITDLGIATGSAVKVASDHHLDNRIMFTAGRAAVELNLFDEKIVTAYGIPLSASGKNIFFDRK